MNPEPCLHMTTHRVTPCLCQTEGFQCQQGRACPARDSELASTAALDPNAQFPAPKEKRMNDYRKSGAWTGFAPRTTEERWPTPPRTASSAGWFKRLVRALFGR